MQAGHWSDDGVNGLAWGNARSHGIWLKVPTGTPTASLATTSPASPSLAPGPSLTARWQHCDHGYKPPLRLWAEAKSAIVCYHTMPPPQHIWSLNKLA